MREEVTAPVTYLVVGAILIALAVVSTLSALLNLGGWNTLLNLGFALASAYLIATYFMRLRLSPPVQLLVVGAGVLWLGILLVGTLDDYVTRGWLPFPGK